MVGGGGSYFAQKSCNSIGVVWVMQGLTLALPTTNFLPNIPLRKMCADWRQRLASQAA